jgi:hypothetical protein
MPVALIQNTGLEQETTMTTWVSVLTTMHTALSVIALLLGLAACVRLSFLDRGASRESLFLGTATLTTLTGFIFPFHGMTPAIGVGVVSVVVLVITYLARSQSTNAGRGWRIAYVVGITVSEYFLCFVAIAQAFAKIPALHAMAPTQKEPPFGIAQGLLLVLFVVFAVLAIRRSTPGRRVVLR